jgi:hypothetical protein
LWDDQIELDDMEGEGTCGRNAGDDECILSRLENLEAKGRSEDLDVDCRILKWTLEQDGRA